MVPWRYGGPPPSRDIDGFTLVEAMVALLVLSVGVIGVAALHGQSLAAGRSAIYRGQAIYLAGDVADRIRLNRVAQSAYAGAASHRGCDDATRSGGGDCSPSDMAAHDLYVWQQAVAESLPDGLGTVDVDTGTVPATYTVTVSWTDAAEGGRSFLPLTFRLPVY